MKKSRLSIGLVIPYYPETLAEPDTVTDSLYAITIGKDTIGMVEEPGDTLAVLDTLAVDSIQVEEELPYYYLMLFEEIDSTQRLIDANFEKEKLLTFVYRYPPVNPVIEPIGQA